ncbi:GNAT family N-acetyltransferase [Pseudomonas palleroniana]|uniref:GNAT family N-acetyltransferase n=1 Tax=Pseudomonas palleroniana TaxID=191390 RepID=A0A2L1J6I7_9PSED|nr:GNAT family N-acetyltransferase [Pseudomonas palleroniana]AVE04079.1 GNAT family N-acetyltransferase [Pseudomonas palleroniana]
MSAHIRLAHREDAPLLPAIERSAAQVFREIDGLGGLADSATLTVERHQQLIALSTCWVVVDANDQLQGFLSAEPQDGVLHIHEMSVAQAAQGQGWGRKLLETAKDYAQSNALRAVTLTTFKHVPWNAPFYTRLGFKPETDPRLAQILADEYAHGFEPGSRCAMSWSISLG